MGLRGYLTKRAIVAIVTLFVIATLNFMIFQVISPLDPTRTFVDPKFTKAMRDALLAQYGLLEPIQTRYIKYITNIFTWNFGISFATMTPVVNELAWRLPNTVLLLGTALIGTVLVGLPLGMMAASRRGKKLDMLTLAGGLFANGVPVFFIQLIFLLFFSYYMFIWFGFQFFPSRGMVSIPAPTDPIRYAADVLWHLAQPALSLIVGGFGGWALYIRNMMIDALTQDYITTARAKGLSERSVLYRHAFRGILPPIVTILALSIPGIVTGAVITEYIFTWPGIGSWYLAGLLGADFPVVQAVFFLYALLMLIANLVADLLYGVLDPRVRVGIRR